MAASDITVQQAAEELAVLRAAIFEAIIRFERLTGMYVSDIGLEHTRQITTTGLEAEVSDVTINAQIIA